MIYSKVDKNGIVYNSNGNMVVRKTLLKGEKLNKHNHPNCEVFFNVLKGSVEVYLNDKKSLIMNTSDIINFDGINYISANILEDTVVLIYLLKK